MPFVTHEQPAYTGAMSRFDYSPAIEKLFTFTTQYKEEVALGYRDSFDHFWVPRGSCPIGKIDGRTDGEVEWPKESKLKLWEDQPECCARSIALLENDESHILDAPTGWGKTVAGVHVGCLMGRSTLIVVPKSDLEKNWLDSLEMAGIPESQIGIARGKKTEDWHGKRFVIGMVQSLMRPEKFSDEFWAYFGLLIPDEVHAMGADKFSYVMQRSRARLRLGLSATPKRKDGKQPVVEYHIGPVRVFGKNVPMSPRVGVRQTGYRLPAEPYVKADGTQGIRPMRRLLNPGQPTLAYQEIAKDFARNDMLVRAAMQCYAHPECHHILLMSALTDHLWALFHKLCKAGVNPSDIGWYVGTDPKNGKNATKAELATAATKRVILTTDRMSGMGTNFPKWDTIILCLPWPDVKQKVGRVLRKDLSRSDKLPRVFDFVDADGMYQGFFKAREKYYFEVKAEVKRLKPI